MDRETWEGYHRLLGLPSGASKEEVKAAYRRLVREHHPDAVEGTGAAKRRGEAAFKAIQEAYEAIRDWQGPPPIGDETVSPAPPAAAGTSPAAWIGAGLVAAAAVFLALRIGHHVSPKAKTRLETATKAEVLAALKELREKGARMDGPFNFALPGGARVFIEDSTGADVLLLNEERRIAVERLRREGRDVPELPPLALDFHRGVLTGVVRRRPLGAGYEVSELGLSYEGADTIRIEGWPDGPGILLSHFRGGLSLGVTAVTAFDYGPRP